MGREILYPVPAEEKEDSSVLISAPSRHTWEMAIRSMVGAFVLCPLGTPRYEQSAVGMQRGGTLLCPEDSGRQKIHCTCFIYLDKLWNKRKTIFFYSFITLHPQPHSPDFVSFLLFAIPFELLSSN